MKTLPKSLAAALMVATVPWFGNSALAVPMAVPSSSWRDAAAVPVQAVQYRGWRGGWGGG